MKNICLWYVHLIRSLDDDNILLLALEIGAELSRRQLPMSLVLRDDPHQVGGETIIAKILDKLAAIREEGDRHGRL